MWHRTEEENNPLQNNWNNKNEDTSLKDSSNNNSISFWNMRQYKEGQRIHQPKSKHSNNKNKDNILNDLSNNISPHRTSDN